MSLAESYTTRRWGANPNPLTRRTTGTPDRRKAKTGRCDFTRKPSVHVEDARTGGDHHHGVPGSVEIAVHVVLVEHIQGYVERLQVYVGTSSRREGGEGATQNLFWSGSP